MNDDHMPEGRYRIAALYKFVDLPDAAALRPEIEQFCRARGLCGTLLIAPEGINGTVAGTPSAIADLVGWLEDGNLFGGRFRGAEIKYSDADVSPFLRMKVRLKTEIVTLRAPEANPARRTGSRVSPEEWNALIGQDDVVVLDTRNGYEVELGSFEGARDPGTASFSDFKSYVNEHLDPGRDRRIAMFCTGGIRCEKASSYLLAHGFEAVYQLDGGILRYLETVPAGESRFRGECFVFDERVSVTHGLATGQARLCRACRHPVMPEDRTRADYIEGVQCRHCAASAAPKREGAEERQRQVELAEARGLAHLGDAARAAASRLAAEKRARRAAARSQSAKAGSATHDDKRKEKST